MGKEQEEGFLEDTRWVGDVVTGDVPGEHGTSDAGEFEDGCSEDSSSEAVLLISTSSRGMTIDRGIVSREMSSRIFFAR